MKNCFAIFALGWAVVSTALGQQPKSTTFPPINAAQAKLDLTLGGLNSAGLAIAVNDRSESLIVATERGDLLFWPRTAWLGVRGGSAAPDAMHAHDGPITAMATDGRSALATAGVDRKIRIWNLPNRDAKLTLDSGHLVRSLAVSADGKRLAAGDESGAVQLFDLPSGKPVGSLSSHKDWVLTIAFSPDGTRLASGSDDGHVLLWDVVNAKLLRPFSFRPDPSPKSPPAPVVPITALAFRPAGKAVAAGDFTGQIHLLNATDGKLIRTMQTGHASSVAQVGFHPSGTILASAGRDRVIKLWNPDTGQMVVNLEGHASWVQGIVFLEKGTLLASASVDQTVRIWSLTPKK